MNFKEKIKARLYSGDVKRMVAKSKIPDQRVSLERLKRLGFLPQSIFDVGAYEGGFSEMCMEIWGEVQVFAFEALPQKINMLQRKFADRRLTVVEGIVGQEDKDGVAFYADETASSVLASDEVNTKKVLIQQKMRRLESFINSASLNPPQLLKIDTQGFEYEVLQGCGEALRSIEAVLLELNFIEVYHESKLAHEVIAYLNEYGFVIYDVCEIHRRPLDMALFQMDFIFIKKDSFLRKDKGGMLKELFR